MINQENRPVVRPEQVGEAIAHQAYAIAALTEALDDFDLAVLGDLFRTASMSLCNDEGTQRLGEIRETIISVLEDYIESQGKMFSEIIERDAISVDIARDVSLKLADLYQQYTYVIRWPEEFKGLVDKYAKLAADTFAHFDPVIASCSDQLRDKFREYVTGLWESFDALPTRHDRSDSIVKAREIAKKLQDGFQGALEIEDAFAWRLGKKVRTLYRKLLRAIDSEFGVNVQLPEVAMDPTNEVVPRKVPRNW